MKKYLLIILLIFSLLVCSYSASNENLSPPEFNVYEVNDTLTSNSLNSVNDATEPVLLTASQDSSTEISESISDVSSEIKKPKYIFIVIGDGMGKGHLFTGSVYSRIENQSMEAGATWEYFSHQSYIAACGESASGGTAIATGYKDPVADVISMTSEGKELYTILDRAKEAGMSTGVITNSFLSDATPATFLTHTDYRGNSGTIAKTSPYSDVDFIMGGGMDKIYPRDRLDEVNYEDACSNSITKTSQADILSIYEEKGYSTYIAKGGGKSLLEKIEDHEFTDEKVLGVFTFSRLPYEIERQSIYRIEEYEYAPSLVQMTEAGIQSLSQNENGFVLMIEEAFIDKTGHKGDQLATTSQVDLANKTLIQIMEFYEQHPDETLVILTADHETGNYKVDEENLNTFFEYEDFTYTADTSDMYDFLLNEWDLYISPKYLTKRINIAEDKHWDDYDRDHAQLYSYITYKMCIRLGIERQGRGHTHQTVPCFVEGSYSSEFEHAEHTSDIPAIICDIMDWRALPEVRE